MRVIRTPGIGFMPKRLSTMTWLCPPPASTRSLMTGVVSAFTVSSLTPTRSNPFGRVALPPVDRTARQVPRDGASAPQDEPFPGQGPRIGKRADAGASGMGRNRYRVRFNPEIAAT